MNFGYFEYQKILKIEIIYFQLISVIEKKNYFQKISENIFIFRNFLKIILFSEIFIFWLFNFFIGVLKWNIYTTNINTLLYLLIAYNISINIVIIILKVISFILKFYIAMIQIFYLLLLSNKHNWPNFFKQKNILYM